MHKGLFYLSVFTYAEPLACVAVLALLRSKRKLGQYKFLAAFLVTGIISRLVLLPILHFAGKSIEQHLAYELYFYGYWATYAIEAIFGFGIIHGLYHLAMAPLPGLQRLGKLMFRWAGGVALAIAASVAFGPHVTSTSFTVHFVQQLQQTQSILTLCMLLFVTLASKPMGLSHSSKIFGVSLGLGVLAATDLIQSSWFTHRQHMGTTFDLINASAIYLAIGIWATYFLIPEPRRRMIVLPTTSPFLRWNQISAALGDEPGFVAIGEVTPEMFAPAELEVMLRASRKIDHAKREAIASSVRPTQLLAEIT